MGLADPSRPNRESQNLLVQLLRTSVCALVLFAVAAPGAQAAPGLQFGAYTAGSGYGGNVSPTNQLEQQLQRRISIVSWYTNWSDNAPINYNAAKAVRGVRASGRTPLITWEPWRIESGTAWQPDYELSQIISGRYDGYIRRYARNLKSTRTTVYVRMMHEMNGDFYPWSGATNNNNAKRFKKAWRHVVGQYRKVGARNVRFVWSPLNIDVPRKRSNRMENYYPGKRYVHVLALDGFNWGNDQPGWGGWQSFRKVFKQGYKRVSRLGKQPIWFTEVATVANGGDKAKWVRDMFTTAAKWPRLKAIVWYDGKGAADRNRNDFAAASVATAFHSQP
jgi:beta-mannanase